MTILLAVFGGGQPVLAQAAISEASLYSNLAGTSAERQRPRDQIVALLVG